MSQEVSSVCLDMKTMVVTQEYMCTVSKPVLLQVKRAVEAVDSSDSDQTDSEIGDTKVR